MSTTDRRIRGLRGATTVESNEAEAIVSATAELLELMMARNDLVAEDLVSVVFTATPDLDAAFSASAARAAGLSLVPVIGAMEVAVPGAPERCVRVLMHLYTDREASVLRHVYLREARSLPSDLPE